MMGVDKAELANLERLPWLESAEPEDDGDDPGLLRTLMLVLVGLLLLAGVIFGIYRFQHRAVSADGDGALIKAPAGDYKVKPEEPGGLKVSGEGDSAIAASAGANSSAAIDLSAVPEAPIDGRRAAARPAPAATGAARAVAEVPRAAPKLTATAPASAPRAPVPGAGSGGALVQLGAFPSEAVANAAWSAMAKRFSYLATLGKSVQAADVNGRKVYRLRVNAGSAGAASDICGRLKVAGERCFVTS